MTIRPIAMTFVLMVSTAFGQHRVPYWSLGGFGNVLFPGTGHPPATPPGGITGAYFFQNAPKVRDHWPPGTVVLSGPEVAGPEDSDGLPEQDYRPVTTIPASVLLGGPPQVIERQFIGQQDAPQPEGNYQSGAERPSEPTSGCESSVRGSVHKAQQNCDGKPTVYLLALKDGSVLQSLGYWIRDSILYYVSIDYALNQISLALIDNGVSKRLNAERGINFSPDLTK